MKSFRILLVFVLLAGLFSCQSHHKVTFTLVQYNVGAFKKYEASGIEGIARVARELGADILTLNEIDSCTTRTGKVDQLAAFAQEMDGWNHKVKVTFGVVEDECAGLMKQFLETVRELRSLRAEVEVNWPPGTAAENGFPRRPAGC